MLTGSIKEAGLLVLLNQHIQRRWGESPLGETFNVRTAPHDPQELLALVKQRIPGWGKTPLPDRRFQTQQV